MSVAAELDGLLSRLVDDQLDDAGTARLQEVLRGDAGARRRYRQVLALHAGLQWDYVAAAREDSNAATTTRSARWWLPWAGAVAASLVVAATIALWRPAGRDALLTATTLNNGSLTWSAGAERRELVEGDTLSAGRLALEGASASAVLRFDDGTSITLSGDSEVEAATDHGKQLHLLHGELSAEVAPQPAGQPLVIRTATARLEVLGTVFTVSAQATSTTLAVERGSVRLERLADGQAVEVAEHQQVCATLDISRPLTTAVRPQVPANWRMDFSQPPPAQWTGLWSPPSDLAIGAFHAVPYVAGRQADGRPFLHQGVRVCAQSGGNRLFVRLHADSRLSVRFRLMRGDSKAPLKIMLGTERDDGAFGGTFWASLDPQNLPADGEGWRTAVVAASAFRGTRSEAPPAPIGRALTFILVNTVTRPAGLEVAELAVETP